MNQYDTNNNFGKSKKDNSEEILVKIPYLSKKIHLHYHIDDLVSDFILKIQKIIDDYKLNFGLFVKISQNSPGYYLKDYDIFSEVINGVSKVVYTEKCRLHNTEIPSTKLINEVNTPESQKSFLNLIIRNEITTIMEVLKRPFDPNYIINNEPLLFHAINNENALIIVTILICYGAHIDYKSCTKLTALHKSVRLGKPKILKLFLDLGLSPNCYDNKGLSPLYYCTIYNKDDECMSLLLNHDAHIVCSDSNGFKEIHQASVNNQPSQIETLIKHGVDVNLASEINGNTPLHCAVIGRSVDSIRYLLANGANPQFANNKKLTPIDLVEEIYPDLLPLFKLSIEPINTIPKLICPENEDTHVDETNDAENEIKIKKENKSINTINKILELDEKEDDLFDLNKKSSQEEHLLKHQHSQTNQETSQCDKIQINQQCQTNLDLNHNIDKYYMNSTQQLIKKQRQLQVKAQRNKQLKQLDDVDNDQHARNHQCQQKLDSHLKPRPRNSRDVPQIIQDNDAKMKSLSQHKNKIDLKYDEVISTHCNGANCANEDFLNDDDKDDYVDDDGDINNRNSNIPRQHDKSSCSTTSVSLWNLSMDNEDDPKSEYFGLPTKIVEFKRSSDHGFGFSLETYILDQNELKDFIPTSDKPSIHRICRWKVLSSIMMLYAKPFLLEVNNIPVFKMSHSDLVEYIKHIPHQISLKIVHPSNASLLCPETDYNEDISSHVTTVCGRRDKDVPTESPLSPIYITSHPIDDMSWIKPISSGIPLSASFRPTVITNTESSIPSTAGPAFSNFRDVLPPVIHTNQPIVTCATSSISASLQINQSQSDQDDALLMNKLYDTFRLPTPSSCPKNNNLQNGRIYPSIPDFMNLPFQDKLSTLDFDGKNDDQTIYVTNAYQSVSQPFNQCGSTESFCNDMGYHRTAIMVPLNGGAGLCSINS